MPHGSVVSTLPQVEQVDSVRRRRCKRRQQRLAARSRASSSGAAPRAAPSAGPSPGSRASACAALRFPAIAMASRRGRQIGLLRKSAIGRRDADHLHGNARISPCRALDALVEAGHEVVAVYCQPPRPAGRGKARAQDRRSTSAPKQLGHRGAHTRRRFATRRSRRVRGAGRRCRGGRGLWPDPAASRSSTRRGCGCLNVHASLLPRWRGAAPIQRAILAGDDSDRRHHHADGSRARYRADAAQAASCRSTARLPGKSRKNWRNLALTALVEGLGDPTSFRPSRSPRTASTYAAKIDKAEARIDWTRAAERDRAPGPRLRPRPRRLVRGRTASGSSCSTPKRRRRSRHARRGARRLPDHRLRRGLRSGRRMVQRAGRGAMTPTSCCAASPIPEGTILP